jgi:hypothetical protein
MKEYSVNIGGLMRCCLATLDEHMLYATEDPEEDETLDCKYEEPGNKNMVFRDNAWQWNRTDG